MSATIEKTLRVYNDKEGVSILVGTHSDGPEFGIELKVTDERSRDWFGDVMLHLGDKDHAIAVGKAIIEMAQDMESNQ